MKSYLGGSKLLPTKHRQRRDVKGTQTSLPYHPLTRVHPVNWLYILFRFVNYSHNNDRNESVFLSTTYS